MCLRIFLLSCEGELSDPFSPSDLSLLRDCGSMIKKMEAFPSEVQEKLKYYVYRLIDPRNGETFYIGKGSGNRVFQHVRAELSFDEDESPITAKIARIREIIQDGFQVIHIVQRHGLTSEQATLVEATLIDVFPGLTNLKDGVGTGDFGAMPAEAILRKYQAACLVLRHRTIFFTITSGFEGSWYEACRGVWRVSFARAMRAELVMPVYQGLVRDVFQPIEWIEATPENFQKLSRRMEGRFGFVGRQAESELLSEYVNKRLPDRLTIGKRSMNPVRYSYS